MPPDLSGIEFDWFAADSEGNMALFATAGEGFFPSSVAEHHADHAALSDSLRTPRYGTPEMWKDYADCGLYVFDWALPGGPYEKREAPTGVASQELNERIMALPELPRFGGLFSGHEKLELWR